MNNDSRNAQPAGAFRPTLAFYHPNGKGSGAAAKLELHPAQGNGGGCIMLNMANQLTVGDRRGPRPTFASFNWEKAICVKLDFNDITKMLLVFRGMCESIDEGRGIYHRSPKASTRIVLRHVLEPLQGYALELYRTPVNQGEEETRARIIFNPAEALGLCEAIAGSLSLICFGMPQPVARTIAADRAERREARDARAA